MSRQKAKTTVFFVAGVFVLTLLLAWGSVRAYSRGGNDFSVFYEAWRLVLGGRGADIYQVSPDRFLYSPGFAWILAPLGLLPRELSLGVWCLGKWIILIDLVRRFALLDWTSSSSKRPSILSMSLMIWSILFISRPLLIDLEYGQVNLYLLWACLWGLLGHFENSIPWKDFLRWFTLGFFAVSKLFPMPLLIVPWVVTQDVSQRKLRIERIALILGGGASILLPFPSLGFAGVRELCAQWYQALLARGLPLEAHNQSFTAFLNHYLSGNPTQVLSEGIQPVTMGVGWLSMSQIALLSLAWTGITIGVVLGWILSGNSRTRFQWIAVLVGLLIIPSHLVWKPYFVFSLPMIFWLMKNSVQLNSRGFIGILFLIFLGINFTGFDFVGHHWGAQLEAASVLLLAHLCLLVLSLSVGKMPANQTI